jgi:hypothetical protein
MSAIRRSGASRKHPSTGTPRLTKVPERARAAGGRRMLAVGLEKGEIVGSVQVSRLGAR